MQIDNEYTHSLNVHCYMCESYRQGEGAISDRLNLLLYAFLWVIPRRLNFICRRFGTHCLVHLHRRIWYEGLLGLRMLEYLYGKSFGSSQTFSHINTPTFSNLVILRTLSAYEDGPDRVFRNVGI